MKTIDRLFDEVTQLPLEQRLALACRILESGEPSPGTDIDSAWDREIRARIDRYDRGGSQLRSSADVLAEVDRRLAR